MKRIFGKFLLLAMLLALAVSVRAQGNAGVLTITASSTPTAIVLDQAAVSVCVRENSNSPSNAFTITVGSSTVGIQYAAGTNYCFVSANNPPFAKGQTVGTIAIASSTAPFVAIEGVFGNGSKVSSTGGSSGNATSLQGVPIDSTPPTDQQALVYSQGSGKWAATTIGGDPCDASTVSLYTLTHCEVDVNTANLLAMSNGTPFIAVSAPGAGKQIVWQATSYGEYIFNSSPFSADGSIGVCYTNSFLDCSPTGLFSQSLQFSSSANAFVYGGASGSQGAVGDALNQAIYLSFEDSNIAGGPIGSIAINSGGAADGVNSIQVTSGQAGLGYAATNRLQLDGGNGDAFLIVDTVSGLGAILTAHVAVPGTGYTTATGQGTGCIGCSPSQPAEFDILTVGGAIQASDTFLIQGGNTDATGHVVSVNANGQATAVALDSGGTAYFNATGSAVTFTSGVGVGLTLNLSGVVPQGNGSAVFHIFYMVIQLP